MKSYRYIYLINVVLFILMLNACKPTERVDTIISNVNVIDVVEGRVIKGQDVIIEGTNIKRIMPHGEFKLQAKQLVDGESKYLIPGLWDMHVHTGNADIFFPLYIANGITGVRDMGGGMERSTGNLSIKFQKLSLWRNEVIQGKRLGPEMLLAGSMIDGSPTVWPGTIGVTDSLSIHKAVQEQKELGVDFIKVYHNLNLKQLTEVAIAAKSQDIKFAGHVPLNSHALETLLQASKLGQSSIEHMIQVQVAISKGDVQINSFMDVADACNKIINRIDLQKEKQLYDVFRKNDTWLTPTVSVWWGVGQLDREHNNIYQKWLDYIPDHITNEWHRNPFQDVEMTNHPPEDYETFRGAALGMAKVAKRMYDEGVNLMAASDSENPGIVPGYGLHKELELLVLGGFTPVEVLRLATVNPAIFLNRTDIGIISVGARADLVILDEDPLIDITNISLIDGVILQGKYLDKEKLDELLEQAKRITNKK
jgi:hypothetical protein